MQKIVIFDMDGTLIDSKKDLTISINYVRSCHHNLPPLSESFVVEAINMHERNLPKLFYNTQTYEQRDRDLFEHHYKQQCTQHSHLYKGIYEMLELFEEHGIVMGVATNAPTLFAKIMLQHLHVSDKFKIIVGADMVAASKPDPEMIYKILQVCHYDATCDKAWMVGDNSKDIESAQKAGIQALFVTWGFSSYNENFDTVSSVEELITKVMKE